MEILDIYNNQWQGVLEFDYIKFMKNHLSLFLVPHSPNFIWSFLVLVWEATENYQSTSKKLKWLQPVSSASPFHPSCMILLNGPVTTELWEQGAAAPTSSVLYFYLNCFVLVEVYKLYITVARTERRKARAIRNVLICCVVRLKTQALRATRRQRGSLMIQYKNNSCVAYSGSWYIPSETGTPCAEWTQVSCVLWTFTWGSAKPDAKFR